MNTVTINTIMTFVVRMQETIVLDIPGKNHHYIEWNKTYAEPQIMYQNMFPYAPIEHGIVDCIVWLRELPGGTTYHVYKNVYNSSGEVEA